jgi:hypothetical protein
MILYGICINDKKYDYIYIAFIYFLFLHWTFLKSECILSYYFRKLENNNYELGLENSKDDFDYLFGNYKKYFISIIFFGILINILIIGNRNNIKKHYIYIYIFIFTFYLHVKDYFKNHNKNTNFQLFNEIIKILLILFGIYFYINNKI